MMRNEDRCGVSVNPGWMDCCKQPVHICKYTEPECSNNQGYKNTFKLLKALQCCKCAKNVDANLIFSRSTIYIKYLHNQTAMFICFEFKLD